MNWDLALYYGSWGYMFLAVMVSTVLYNLLHVEGDDTRTWADAVFCAVLGAFWLPLGILYLMFRRTS
jgi:apolipoprotein N-acyltransferase